MSFKSIRLPAIVLQELYPRSLVNPVDEVLVVETGDGRMISYLGRNKKRILILMNSSNGLKTNPALPFLTGILNACQLDLKDVAITNLNDQPLRYRDLANTFHPFIIFLFGVTPESIALPVVFPHFQVQKVDQATFLAAPPLEDLEADVMLKSKLWLCLRQIFEI